MTQSVHSSLHPSYDGPYRVVNRTRKYFTLDVNGRQEVVSIDRIKPAHIDKVRQDRPTPTCDTPLTADNPNVHTPALPALRRVHWSDSPTLQSL